MTQKKAVFNGVKTVYKIEGKGKKIIFLHGWGGSKDSWKPLIGELGLAEFECLSVDMPGFGESDSPDKGWSVCDYADWLEDLMVKTGFQKPDLLITHSFGGRVAIKYCSRSPNFIGNLALIASAGIKRPKSLKIRLIQKLSAIFKKILSLPGLSFLFKPFQKILYKLLKTHDYEQTSGVMRETFLKTIDEDLTHLLSKIQQKTLIVWGTEDTYVPVVDAGKMLALIPNSRAKIISGGRHGIHLKYAKEVALRIKKFLSEKI